MLLWLLSSYHQSFFLTGNQWSDCIISAIPAGMLALIDWLANKTEKISKIVFQRDITTESRELFLLSFHYLSHG